MLRSLVGHQLHIQHLPCTCSPCYLSYAPHTHARLVDAVAAAQAVCRDVFVVCRAKIEATAVVLILVVERTVATYFAVACELATEGEAIQILAVFIFLETLGLQ